MTRTSDTKANKLSLRRIESQVYPFAAIVGQDEMKLALLLNAIDPLIGGVLVMGHRGTGKSTAVRALADLLPSIWKVHGCAYACDPADIDNLCASCFEELNTKGKLTREKARVPVVDLPLGATEDRVCGTINLERALTAGVKSFEAGLLARANRGFLYVDEVNLLEDHLVDLLLDVAVTGRNKVEREGISLEHPARFVLVGSGNPEEGELRPQLLDRFGLFAEVRTVDDLDQRVRIVELREAFESDPVKLCASFEAHQEKLRKQITRARKLAGHIKLSPELLRKIAALCLRLKIDGHRGELTMARAARALAAFEGRRKVTEEDVRRVAMLSLRHRLRRDPLGQTDGGARIEQALADSFPQSEAGQVTGQMAEPNKSRDRLATDNKKNYDRKESESSDENHSYNEHNKDAMRPALASLEAHLPPAALEGDAALSSNRRTQLERRGRGVKSVSYNNRRGRYARSVMQKSDDSKVALDATLRAAVINQTRRRVDASKAISHSSFLIDASALRYKKFKRKQGALFLLAVDTSGSMALNRIAQAKGALVWLLNQSYVRRDRVAIVSFRGTRAEEILQPSQSMSRARRLLDELLMGGATPLSSALAHSLAIAERAARQGTESIMLLLFTDGRPNVPLDDHGIKNAAQRRGAIMSELEQLGAALRKAEVTTVLVDTQNRYTSGNECRELAQHLGGRYVHLPANGEISSLI